jgi:hypothetical protein
MNDLSPRFQEALRRFDAANSQDPHTEQVDGQPRPRELAYAQWLTDWVLRLCPGASEELRLAARSQHLCRWTVPRSSYPLTRAGYLRWREDLKHFHAKMAGEILREVGYPETVVARVQALNLKKGFPDDPESRVLEDALCLVFLEHQFAQLAAKLTDDKIFTTVRKTWAKMSPMAQARALQLPLSPSERNLLERSLGGLEPRGTLSHGEDHK